MKFSSLLPEEIRNANLANKDLSEVARHGENPIAYLMFNLLVMFSGFSCGYFFYSSIDESLLEAVVTFSGVIIGFVITAMLFSGRSAFAVNLSIEQVRRYVLKTKYMLLSQANTLFSFLFCLVFCLVSLFAMKTGLTESKRILVAMVFVYFFLGGYRILLLPYQIYEVHSFSLNNLVSEKAAELRLKTKVESEARRRQIK